MTIFNMRLSRKYRRKIVKPVNRKIDLLIFAGEIIILLTVVRYYLMPEFAKWIYYHQELVRW